MGQEMNQRMSSSLKNDDVNSDTQRSSLIPASIIVPTDSNDQITPCFLVDCDEKKCLLWVNVSHTLNQRDILIRVLNDDDGRQLEVVGRVTGTQSHSIDTTTFVCEFLQPLSSEALTLLDDLAMADRREKERQDCMVGVSVRRAEHHDQVVNARMVDESSQGLRLQSDIAFEPGETIVVQKPNGEHIWTTIHWSKYVNGLNQAGAGVATPPK